MASETLPRQPLPAHRSVPRRIGGELYDGPRAALRVVQPSNGFDLAAAEQAAAALLVALGLDLDTESLAATPARMVRAYAEMFSPRPST